MRSDYPLLVIGAGPGGISAAVSAADQGAEVGLLDDQPAPGGQIFRQVETQPAERAALLGPDYQRGAGLVRALRDSRVDYQPDTAVWSIEPLAGPGAAGTEVGVLQHGRARLIRARRLVLAGGAMERPLPFPGWTLPGVMNAGAAQILLKASGLVPANRVVIAGTGPLLLLLAWQYLRAGIRVEAVLETAPLTNLLAAARHLPRALLAGHYLLRGFGYLRSLRRAGVPVLYRVDGLRAHGDTALERVEYRRHGRWHGLDTTTLLVHFGLVPNLHLSDAAGCRRHWHPGQQCWLPQLDDWGNSSTDGVALVGDNAAIAGARAAEHAGRLAGLEAARALGLVSTAARDRQARRDRSWLKADLHIRPFLEALYRLPAALLNTADETTLVCRCESVTAGRIRAAVRDGHRDPNQVKFYTRCGMGPCQGRQCGHALAQIVAAETGRPVDGLQPLRTRPPLTPITLAQLAALQDPPAGPDGPSQ